MTELRNHIPDWNAIYRFAVYRDASEIIESDYRLHRSLADAISLEPEFQQSVRAAGGESLQQFARRRWHPWTHGRSPWDHWTTGCGDIHRYEFTALSTEWPRLLGSLGLPEIPLIQCNASQ
ncbi:hypothetical protein [Stieleria neptunia]|uniref:hypothetical protein n=1 Tax=Stieleria neptunia TaxID=2527979 RepID=UPI00119D9691|nr:hypothetical protein [Stieleria neptunia]